MANDNEPNNFTHPYAIVSYLIAGAFSGGIGLGSFAGPGLDKSAIESLAKTVEIAVREIQSASKTTMATATASLQISTKNAVENNQLRQLIYDKTNDRWKADDAAKDREAQNQRNDQQDRAILTNQRSIDTHNHQP